MKVLLPVGRKRERVALLYQTDFNTDTLIRTDLLIDENGDYSSPVTPKFKEAILEPSPKWSAIPKRDFQVRKIENCQSGDTLKIRSIVCPFTLFNEQLQQIKEVLSNYPADRTRLLGESQSELYEKGLI